MGKFRDNSAKKVIREEWSEPLISFIRNKLGCKLVYLGLPGPKALDLLCWISHIKCVVAFICREYPKPSSVSQSDAEVVKLTGILNELERQKQIETFAVYDGFMEQVVLKGSDILGNPFSLNDIVTIYNLDFCNAITSPVTVVDDQGNTRDVYKSEVIRKLLEIQRDITRNAGYSRFVMFITIHSAFLDEEEKEFKAQTRNADLKGYIRKIGKLKGTDKAIRSLKAYLYNIIINFFCSCEFTPEILPIIYYKGSGANWLMHFTVIGSHNKGRSSVAPHIQDPQNFLNQEFLTIKNGEIDSHTTPSGFAEKECIKNSVNAFKGSKCYSELWGKTK